ncbi:iron-sulfur assembly protein IscA-like 2, mitochondrial [Euphorbia lathyris]|uniref:iron-sulfur assembly protein IscA-like 2, mitochondrial n=1 Tax=Euphorbia lathyris TaxID=212925 RepID=UPI00331387CC
MSRSSLLHRILPFITYRIRQNHRLLNSSSALPEPSSPHPSSSSSYLDDSIHLTDNCVRRMKELQASEGSTEGKMLRLGVDTGGCSGFQYVFNLENKINEDDRVIEKDGVKLIVDSMSYDFVKGATIDYSVELIRSAFVVIENPSAVGGCSCKSSFMVKQ